MTFEEKAGVVISQLRADRDRLQNALEMIRTETKALIENVPYIRPFENIEIVQYTKGFIDGVNSTLDLIDKYTIENEK